jgi:hypothetical protein
MSIYEEQKAVKPKIEDVAGDYLSGDKLQELLGFAAFLRDNKLTPRWQSVNSWSVKYKNKLVCYVKINAHFGEAYVEGSWFVSHSNFTREKWFGGYEDFMTDEAVKNFVLDNIQAPVCAEKGCQGVRDKVIFGKKFDAVCNCWCLRLQNLSGEPLELEKRLVLSIRDFIGTLA